MAQVGQVLLALAWASSLVGLGVIAGGVMTGKGWLFPGGRLATWVAATATTLASGLLLYSLLVSDFSLRYVTEHTSRTLPVAYKVSAFWAGQEGSLLLWAWVLSLYTAYVTAVAWSGQPQLCARAAGVMSAVQVFFLLLLTFVTSPFAALSPVPADGAGLNPMLQNPGMFFHPVTLYLGYVGFTVPFAFALASLHLGRSDGRWLELSRPWTMWSWLFLSVGILLGMQWAYVELGWGGYWGWDPVENASLLPWLTATAFLHSALMQERRGLLRAWNVGLVVATFFLTVLGTFITRSGILSSVHSFADSGLGVYFLVFLVAVLLGSAYLIVRRLPILRDQEGLDTFLSRETAVILADVLLVAFAFIILWGTVFPIVSRALGGVEVAVGSRFFDRAAVPFGAGTVALLAVCPALGWRRARWSSFWRSLAWPGGITVVVAVAYGLGAAHTGSFSPGTLAGLGAACLAVTATLAQLGRDLARRRHRRRYGGLVVHLAVAFMVVGFAGSAFRQEITVTVPPGQTLEAGGYTVTYQGLEAAHLPHRVSVYARLEVTRGGKAVAVLLPEKQYYPHFPPVSEVAILGGWRQDLYTVLADWKQDGSAILTIIEEPLVAWIWLGGYILVAGTLLAAWPSRHKPAEQGGQGLG
ncbi:MAG TPA: heme lyase CcmF/NrfE family subunit [Firmicutes bacterium]|nr:heme lyase CcmF/NrfE family subunit [Bacillota bacterium]